MRLLFKSHEHIRKIAKHFSTFVLYNKLWPLLQRWEVFVALVFSPPTPAVFTPPHSAVSGLASSPMTISPSYHSQHPPSLPLL